MQIAVYEAANQARNIRLWISDEDFAKFPQGTMGTKVRTRFVGSEPILYLYPAKDGKMILQPETNHKAHMCQLPLTGKTEAYFVFLTEAPDHELRISYTPIPPVRRRRLDDACLDVTGLDLPRVREAVKLINSAISSHEASVTLREDGLISLSIIME